MTEVKLEILKDANGDCPKNGQTVTVHYVGTLPNGKQFDSSRDRGKPLKFVLGKGDVIKGWEIGVAKMKVGQRVKLTCPPELGYGERGVPGVYPSLFLIITNN